MLYLKLRAFCAAPIAVAAAAALAGCSGGGNASMPVTPPNAQSAAATADGNSGVSLTATSAPLATTSASVANAYSQAVLGTSPLLAYYQLGDSGATLVDSGPHALNGVYGSNVTHGFAPITQGASTSVHFPGGASFNANGFAFTAPSSLLQPAQITVEAWINFNAAIPANAYVPIAVYGASGKSYGLYLQGRGNNVQTLFYQQTNAGVSTRLLLHGATHLSAGTTYHVVAVSNGTTVSAYVDGLPDVSATYPGSIGYPAGAPVGVQIGGEQSGADASFSGTIAQVAIYGSALPQSTIAAHYLAGEPPMMTYEAATPADSFVDSIGINTHFIDASGLYMQYLPQVETLLKASGIRHFRDNVSFGSSFVTAVKQLAAAGIHGDYVFNSLNFTQSQVQGYPAVVSPSLESFESPNEQDDQGKANWQQPCIAFQKSFYTWVKSDPATAAYPVLGPALGFASDYSQIGSLSGYLDYGNFHDYMGAYNPGFSGGPFGGIKAMLAMEQATSGSKPVMSTESGYGTIVQTPGLDYAADLRYKVRTFFEQFNDGIARSYSYEFIDERTTANPYATFGLLTNTLTPKPAYTAIKGLIAALKDPGAPFKASGLSYNISSLGTVHHLLMQKRNGQFILAVWQEVPSWNVASGTDIAVANQNVTFSTAAAFKSASLTTMDQAGNLSTAPLTWSNGQTTFGVSDNVSLLTLTP